MTTSGRRVLSIHVDQLQRRLDEASHMNAVGRLAGSVSHDFDNLAQHPGTGSNR